MAMHHQPYSQTTCLPRMYCLQACRVCVKAAATLLVRVPVIISLHLMLWCVAGVVALPWFAYNVTAGVSRLPRPGLFSITQVPRLPRPFLAQLRRCLL